MQYFTEAGIFNGCPHVNVPIPTLPQSRCKQGRRMQLITLGYFYPALSRQWIHLSGASISEHEFTTLLIGTKTEELPDLLIVWGWRKEAREEVMNHCALCLGRSQSLFPSHPFPGYALCTVLNEEVEKNWVQEQWNSGLARRLCSFQLEALLLFHPLFSTLTEYINYSKSMFSLWWVPKSNRGKNRWRQNLAPGMAGWCSLLPAIWETRLSLKRDTIKK